MSKFCSKCGSEITESSKFCKQCGAVVESPVEPENKAVVVKKKQEDIKFFVKLGAALVAMVLFISLLSNVFGVPDYEKPLKNQVAAINQNNTKKYFNTFVYAQREEFEEDDWEEYYKERFEDMKKMSYEVISTMSEDSLGYAWRFAEEYFTTGIDEVMTLETEITYETVDGDEGTVNVDFVVAKSNGQWYAITDLAD